MPRLQQRREWMPPIELVAAVADEYQRLGPRQPSCQVIEQLSGCRISPMNVLDDQQKAAILSGHGQKRDHRLEQTELRLCRITHRRGLTLTKLRKQLRK